MRIIAGTARGRRLRTPRGRGLRPTPDRVREALFGILAADVPGAAFLDAYAGTGAVGLEALSRGAASACLVEADPAHSSLIRENLERTGLASRARVLAMPVLRALGRLGREGGRFDLAYLDPPYADAEERGAAMDTLAASGLLAAAGRVVLELPSRDRPPEPPGLERERMERYGDTTLVFYRGA